MGIILCLKCDMYGDEFLSKLGIVMTLIGIVSLASLLIILFISRIDTKSYLIRYESVKSSIEIARKDGIHEIERAALTIKIIDINRDIAVAQYYNKTFLDIFIHDSVMDLLPLE
ncbi:MAG: hypothetical protein NUV76_02515 [Candidatus Kuenenia sp.]|nr:hypothetical protein [Candidatus Kuenenia sp.]